MDLAVYTDGGSSGNPGPAAAAYVIYSKNKVLFSGTKSLGINTNNFAEYSALVLALEKIAEEIKSGRLINCSEISFFSDSALLVNQVNGLFKVKNPQIREFVLRVRLLEQEIKLPIIYKSIPREKNGAADSLVRNLLYS